MTANLAFASTLEVSEEPRLNQPVQEKPTQSHTQQSPVPQKPKMSCWDLDGFGFLSGCAGFTVHVLVFSL